MLLWLNIHLVEKIDTINLYKSIDLVDKYRNECSNRQFFYGSSPPPPKGVPGTFGLLYAALIEERMDLLGHLETETGEAVPQTRMASGR